MPELLLVVIGLAVFLFVGGIVARSIREAFEARFPPISGDELAGRFPPISDAEFVARCRPGTSPEVALKVRRIVADYLAVEYDRIHPSMRFIEDIGAD